MANKTSLIITSTDTGGKTFSKTLTDVNANASATDLQAFAQGLNGLTKNTYGSAALVERTEVVDKTELPLARASITIGDTVYTEADVDMTQTIPTLTLTFNASDTDHVFTNSDGRKEVRFTFDYIETYAVGEAMWDAASWGNNNPRIAFGVSPVSVLTNGICWRTVPENANFLFVEGTKKDGNARIAIGTTKARRGWLLSVKLNREE